MIKMKDLNNLQGGCPNGRLFYQLTESESVELHWSENMNCYTDYTGKICITEQQLDEMEVVDLIAVSYCRMNIIVK